MFAFANSAFSDVEMKRVPTSWQINRSVPTDEKHEKSCSVSDLDHKRSSRTRENGRSVTANWDSFTFETDFTNPFPCCVRTGFSLVPFGKLCRVYLEDLRQVRAMRDPRTFAGPGNHREKHNILFLLNADHNYTYANKALDLTVLNASRLDNSGVG